MNTLDDHTTSCPMDLAAVQGDDAMLNMLGDDEFEAWLRRADRQLIASIGATVDVNAELARVLDAWRREVDSEPFPGLPDSDTAIAVVRVACKSRGGWAWLVRLVRGWWTR